MSARNGTSSCPLCVTQGCLCCLPRCRCSPLGKTTKEELFHPCSSCVVSRHQKDNLWQAEKLGLMSDKIGFTVEICYPREARGAVSGSPGSDVQQTGLVSWPMLPGTFCCHCGRVLLATGCPWSPPGIRKAWDHRLESVRCVAIGIPPGFGQLGVPWQVLVTSSGSGTWQSQPAVSHFPHFHVQCLQVTEPCVNCREKEALGVLGRSCWLLGTSRGFG